MLVFLLFTLGLLFVAFSSKIAMFLFIGFLFLFFIPSCKRVFLGFYSIFFTEYALQFLIAFHVPEMFLTLDVLLSCYSGS